MLSLIVMIFLGASFTAIAETSYSNCPKVSLALPSNSMSAPRARIFRKCSGTLLRASKIINALEPDVPDAGGKKDYSTKSGLFIYEHILNGLQRFVSIRWARNPIYALSDENGELRYKVITKSNRHSPNEFLFNRIFLKNEYQAFRTKSSKRYIMYSDNNCSVSLSGSSYKPKKQNFHRFRVTCKPFLPEHNCFCFPGK